MEGDLDFGLVFSVANRCDLDTEFVDFDPVDVVEGCLRSVDGVIYRRSETLVARTDERDFLEDHRKRVYSPQAPKGILTYQTAEWWLP
ncbi:MAG: hypothetical protein ACI8U4_003299 [Natronomonas sp.]